MKVTAYGPLAERTAASAGKGDRVTVLADDLIAEAWAATISGEPRARGTLTAREIAASMAFDTLRTGYAARKPMMAGGPGPGRAEAASARAAAGRRVTVEGDLSHGRVPAGAVYVGRAAAGLPASPYANPFPARAHGRDQAIQLYREHPILN